MQDRELSLTGKTLPFRSAAVQNKMNASPSQEQRCPRCDSMNTKFCYYNNYSLTQPRYFCKSCKRYWTKGGSLRNVPLGSGCRKNKKSGLHCNARKVKEARVDNKEFVESSCMDSVSLFAIPTTSALFSPSIPGNSVSQLHDGSSPMDFSLYSFHNLVSESLKSPEESFKDKYFDDFTQISEAFTPNSCDVPLMTAAERGIVSNAGLNLSRNSNVDRKLRTHNCEHGQQKQHLFEPTPCCIMSADQILIDNEEWRYPIQDASAQIFDHEVNYLALSISEGWLDDAGIVPVESHTGSEGCFDPTNDLCYMGGPRIWSDLPLHFGDFT